MRIVETFSDTRLDMRQEDLHAVCELLAESNKKLEEAMFKLKEFKESNSGSDTRMWRAEGDYRGMGNYRMDDYRNNERIYRDDFRYRY